MRRHCREMNALCGEDKVSLNRGPKRKSEPPHPPNAQNRGWGWLPSSFKHTPVPAPACTPPPLTPWLVVSPALRSTPTIQTCFLYPPLVAYPISPLTQ